MAHVFGGRGTHKIFRESFLQDVITVILTSNHLLLSLFLSLLLSFCSWERFFPFSRKWTLGTLCFWGSSFCWKNKWVSCLSGFEKGAEFFVPCWSRARSLVDPRSQNYIGKFLGCGGGIVVCILVFYSDDPSSNPPGYWIHLYCP